MPGKPSKNYFLTVLDAYAKWEGRIKALGTLGGFLFFLIGTAGAAMATALHAATSFLTSFSTTLPLALSVGVVTALVTRFQFSNPLYLAFLAVLTFIGNSFLTKLLGIGLHIDYSQAFAPLSLWLPEPNRMSYGAAFAGILMMPFLILWAYLQLYGPIGFIMATSIGLVTGRIVGRRLP